MIAGLKPAMKMTKSCRLRNLPGCRAGQRLKDEQFDDGSELMIEYLIKGPLWYFSLAVFCIGVLWQLARIVFSKGKTDLSVARGSASSGAIRNVFSRFLPTS